MSTKFSLAAIALFLVALQAGSPAAALEVDGGKPPAPLSKSDTNCEVSNRIVGKCAADIKFCIYTFPHATAHANCTVCHQKLCAESATWIDPNPMSVKKEAIADAIRQFGQRFPQCRA